MADNPYEGGVGQRIVSQQLKFRRAGPQETADEFRNVPPTDQGNRDYRDRGQLGSYSTSTEPFRNPSGVSFDYGYDDGDPLGYGCNAAIAEHGYCEPAMRESPEYDKANYHNRHTIPRHPDEDQGNSEAVESDFAFRSRNRLAKGFLTRPYVPTER